MLFKTGLLLLQCKHIINCKSSNDGLRQQGGGSSNSNHSNSVATGDADYSEWILCSQIVSLAEELGLGLGVMIGNYLNGNEDYGND